VEELGGTKGIEGIGFSLGMERILLAQAKEPAEEKAKNAVDVFVIALDEALFEKGFTLLSALRSEKIRSDIGYKISSLKNQMSLANKLAARFVMILGPDEMAKGVVTLKNMETGEQSQVPVEKIIGQIKTCLSADKGTLC
jgi:histidyl-tRNA synthetase